ncbi:MAG TPA: amidohydrolase family protein, partial [Acetobacteraceae bacterium]|nr:amidohydrolase family protein [Acetobacteraceae bacterium]
PASRPVPPLLPLLRAGVVVAAGSDGVRDTWGPYGNADMLERAMLLGLRNNLRRDDELAQVLEVCTTGGARMLGLADHGLHAGAAADLVLVEAETIADAIVSRPARRLVIKAGRVVAEDGTPVFQVA